MEGGRCEGKLEHKKGVFTAKGVDFSIVNYCCIKEVCGDIDNPQRGKAAYVCREATLCHMEVICLPQFLSCPR